MWVDRSGRFAVEDSDVHAPPPVADEEEEQPYLDSGSDDRPDPSAPPSVGTVSGVMKLRPGMMTRWLCG